MRIVFMGTPDYAEIILENLIKKYEVVAVYTQPDKPVGRKKILKPSPVKVLAQKHNIQVIQPINLKNEAENIKSLKPDFIVVAAFGQILPKDILEIAPCINLHASLLPKYRGASPIQSAILNTFHFFIYRFRSHI
jgi:methionyl-tRNA formyltransferase